MGQSGFSTVNANRRSILFEALERTLRSERISEDVVSTDNELGQPR